MGFKEKLKKSFGDKENITKNRLRSSTFVFIFMAFVFFLNYFFTGADFYYNFFIVTLPYSYILFLLSFSFYFYYAITNHFINLGKPFKYGMIAVLFVLFVFGSFLFVF